jgi:small-conductance mechanosensitive channel
MVYCKAITTKGYSCKKPSKYGQFCSFHQASYLNQIGGQETHVTDPNSVNRTIEEYRNYILAEEPALKKAEHDINAAQGRILLQPGLTQEQKDQEMRNVSNEYKKIEQRRNEFNQRLNYYNSLVKWQKRNNEEIKDKVDRLEDLLERILKALEINNATMISTSRNQVNTAQLIARAGSKYSH